MIANRRNLLAVLLSIMCAAVAGSWVFGSNQPGLSAQEVPGADVPDRAAAEVLSVHEIKLVDESGKCRIRLSARSGDVGVTIYDPDGKGRASFRLDDDGSPFIDMYYLGGDRSVLLSTGHGNAGLYIMGNKKSHPCILAHAEDGRPVLWLGDAAGRIRLAADVSVEGEPRLALLNSEGEAIETLPK